MRSSISGADVGNDCSRLPLHECREPWNFIRGRSCRAYSEHKDHRCHARQCNQNPFPSADLSTHGKLTLLVPRRRAPMERSSLFADVFVPESWILRDKFGKHLHTLVRRKINHFDSVFLQPIDSAAKIHGFAHDNGPDSELAD